MNDQLYILLADDDDDDCSLFNEVLDELQLNIRLTTVKNGEQLMKFLNGSDLIPDMIFLDLNMPRKNGFECLAEINNNDRLKNIPIIIWSTSFNKDIVDLLYNKGAYHYLQKPGNYPGLVSLIHQAILHSARTSIQPAKKDFVLSLEVFYDERAKE